MSDFFSFTLSELARAYRTGEFTSTYVTEAYLERLSPSPIYRLVTEERALAQAKRADEAFSRGEDRGPLQGVPIALKDLMDTEGEVTAAGSTVLAKNPPAARDCPAAARLDEAGAVFLGKTNMTEFAFSGLGMNPHYGTPGNALDASRIPGGSSSGSAVAVASGLAVAAVGSDTGGSVRIPAAFNGLVGLKTTDGAVPTEGCAPLSTTLDTLGPITRTVEDAWHMWRALAGQPPAAFAPQKVAKLRFLAPITILQEDLDPEVRKAFARGCEKLAALGASVEPRDLPVLGEIGAARARYGSFAGLESLALYEDLIEREGDQIDPRVTSRILKQRGRTATDYIRLTYERKRIQAAFWEACAPFDAVLAPTVAILPPKMDDLEDDARYFGANSRVLRNTSAFNFLGTPAVSVPCDTSSGGLSAGLMIATRPYEEHLALSVASALEAR